MIRKYLAQRKEARLERLIDALRSLDARRDLRIALLNEECATLRGTTIAKAILSEASYGPTDIWKLSETLRIRSKTAAIAARDMDLLKLIARDGGNVRVPGFVRKHYVESGVMLGPRIQEQDVDQCTGREIRARLERTLSFARIPEIPPYDTDLAPQGSEDAYTMHLAMLAGIPDFRVVRAALPDLGNGAAYEWRSQAERRHLRALKHATLERFEGALDGETLVRISTLSMNGSGGAHLEVANPLYTRGRSLSQRIGAERVYENVLSMIGNSAGLPLEGGRP